MFHELFDTYILPALLHRSVGVGKRHLGLLAQASTDITVNEAQQGNGTQSNTNDGADSC
jgi:hypothetical protein